MTCTAETIDEMEAGARKVAPELDSGPSAGVRGTHVPNGRSECAPGRAIVARAILGRRAAPIVLGPYLGLNRFRMRRSRMAWTDARRARVAATAAALVALTLPSLVSAQSPITTEAGLVSGAESGVAGVRQSLGIPYAAPPIGPNRWKAPQPA